MNDHEEQVPSFDDPAFDDPAFDDLRALLADARVTEPVPTDVVARLDATLSSLQAERETPATVVLLRRRLAPILVAAAAAVVVVAGGLGIAQVVRNDGASQTMSADNAASGAQSGPAAPPVPESAAGPSSGAAKGDGPAALASMPAFTTARFAEQVAGLDVADLISPTAGDTVGRSPTPTYDGKHPESMGPRTAACTGPALLGTATVPILLDGRTAMLVLHPVTAGKQVVDAWSCDGKQRLTTATVTR